MLTVSYCLFYISITNIQGSINFTKWQLKNKYKGSKNTLNMSLVQNNIIFLKVYNNK